jgi:hypothetical protein
MQIQACLARARRVIWMIGEHKVILIQNRLIAWDKLSEVEYHRQVWAPEFS